MTETELKKFTTRTCGQDPDKGSIILLLSLIAQNFDAAIVLNINNQ